LQNSTMQTHEQPSFHHSLSCATYSLLALKTPPQKPQPRERFGQATSLLFRNFEHLFSLPCTSLALQPASLTNRKRGFHHQAAWQGYILRSFVPLDLAGPNKSATMFTFTKHSIQEMRPKTGHVNGIMIPQALSTNTRCALWLAGQNEPHSLGFAKTIL
jgi:hypothetical protein